MTIKTPNRKYYEGILYLSKQAIIDLNEVLKEINNSMYELFSSDMDKEADDLKKYSWNKERKKNEIKKELMNDNSYCKNKITLVTTLNDEIVVSELIDVLKDDSMNHVKIKEISIVVGYGSRSFNLTIKKENFSDLYYYAYEIPEKELKDFSFIIDNWYSKYSGKILEKAWNFYSQYIAPYFAGIIFVMLLIPFINTFSQNKYDQYKVVLQEKMIEQYHKGFESQDDIQNGMNLLMQLATKTVPEDFIPPKVPNLFTKTNLIIFSITIILIVLFFAPKTNFEIGKDKTKFQIQQKWRKAVLYVIPVMIILPIAIGLFVNKIS